MFLNFLKDIATKKIIKSSLAAPVTAEASEIVKSVGILFDEQHLKNYTALRSALVFEGISTEAIQVLVFREKAKTGEEFAFPYFTPADISWTATVRKKVITDFTSQPFDLLINYYDIEKAFLLLVSHLSKARFKVGFSAVDKRLNHFMIDTSAENHEIFSAELVRYLKILNKL